MKIRNKVHTVYFLMLAGFTLGAGRSVMPIIPVYGYMFFGLSALCAVVAVEMVTGAHALTWLVDWASERERRRKAVEDAASQARHEAAVAAFHREGIRLARMRHAEGVLRAEMRAERIALHEARNASVGAATTHSGMQVAGVSSGG